MQIIQVAPTDSAIDLAVKRYECSRLIHGAVKRRRKIEAEIADLEETLAALDRARDLVDRRPPAPALAPELAPDSSGPARDWGNAFIPVGDIERAPQYPASVALLNEPGKYRGVDVPTLAAAVARLRNIQQRNAEGSEPWCQAQNELVPLLAELETRPAYQLGQVKKIGVPADAS